MLAATARARCRQGRVNHAGHPDATTVTCRRDHGRIGRGHGAGRRHGVKPLVRMHHRTIAAASLLRDCAYRGYGWIRTTAGSSTTSGSLVIEGHGGSDRRVHRLLGPYLAHVRMSRERRAWHPTTRTPDGSTVWDRDGAPLPGRAGRHRGHLARAARVRLRRLGAGGREFSTVVPSTRTQENLAYLHAIRTVTAIRPQSTPRRRPDPRLRPSRWPPNGRGLRLEPQSGFGGLGGRGRWGGVGGEGGVTSTEKATPPSPRGRRGIQNSCPQGPGPSGTMAGSG